jgi:hypothetical protein
MLRAVSRIETMKQEVADLIESYGIRNILAALYAYCETERQHCDEAAEPNHNWLEAREAVGDALDRVSALG